MFLDKQKLIDKVITEDFLFAEDVSAGLFEWVAERYLEDYCISYEGKEYLITKNYCNDEPYFGFELVGNKSIKLENL